MALIVETKATSSHDRESLASPGTPRRRPRKGRPRPRAVASERAELKAQVREWVESLRGGLSQRRIADATGFNRETVRRYLKCTSTIPAEFVLALCKCRGMMVTLNKSEYTSEDADRTGST
jgi:hypothetical protein